MTKARLHTFLRFNSSYFLSSLKFISFYLFFSYIKNPKRCSIISWFFHLVIILIIHNQYMFIFWMKPLFFTFLYVLNHQTRFIVSYYFPFYYLFYHLERIHLICIPICNFRHLTFFLSSREKYHKLISFYFCVCVSILKPFCNRTILIKKFIFKVLSSFWKIGIFIFFSLRKLTVFDDWSHLSYIFHKNSDPSNMEQKVSRWECLLILKIKTLMRCTNMCVSQANNKFNFTVFILPLFLLLPIFFLFFNVTSNLLTEKPM